MAELQQHRSPPIRYQTTRPIFPLTPDRKVIETQVNDTITIQLRRFEPADSEHVHRLHTQERVMVNTSASICDANHSVTQTWMDRFLPPNDAMPHVGYMLRTEWWGKGIATKALQAFLATWWALERRQVAIDLRGVDDEHQLHLMRLEWDDSKWNVNPSVGMQAVPEILLAEIEERNMGSIKVVEKCGFEYRAREIVTKEQGSFVLLDYTATNPTTQ